MTKMYLALTRLVFGILTLGAIVVQFSNTLAHNWNVANFFSFFTIESNILGTITLFILSTMTLTKSSRDIALFRGAATLYMTMTGVVYVLLLAGNEVSLQTTIPWVNFVLHYFMPALLLLDWLCFPPKQAISYRQSLLWLVFPLVYLVYSLIRGAVTGWYPYPFLNPVTNGWGGVAIISLGITFFALLTGWLLSLRTRHASRS